MASRVRAVINLVQELSALDPKRQKPTIRQLLILLKIRKTQLVSKAAAKLLEYSVKIAIDPEYKTISLVLAKEAEILTLFQGIADEEVKILEKYLRFLDSNGPDSLANFLAKKIDAEIQDRHNLDNFSDPKIKAMIVNMALGNVDYEEDFQLKIKPAMLDFDLMQLIIEYYVARGYKLKSKNDLSGLMFEKGKNFLFINVSQFEAVIMVTVTKY